MVRVTGLCFLFLNLLRTLSQGFPTYFEDLFHRHRSYPEQGIVPLIQHRALKRLSHNMGSGLTFYCLPFRRPCSLPMTAQIKGKKEKKKTKNESLGISPHFGIFLGKKKASSFYRLKEEPSLKHLSTQIQNLFFLSLTMNISIHFLKYYRREILRSGYNLHIPQSSKSCGSFLGFNKSS